MFSIGVWEFALLAYHEFDDVDSKMFVDHRTKTDA